MLHKLVIQNFQTHKDLGVTLGPHVTTIVGTTDAGKSSVLRALGWVALNRPTGDAFIRDGARAVSVELGTEKHDIIRERGPGKNTYVLRPMTDPGSAEVFTADRKSVV